MPSLSSPNQPQETAIHHCFGPIQVLAGPGSGKTYTIVKHLSFLLETMKISPEQILVITFTKAAALEMQSRFRAEVKASHIAVNFGTFHSIYYQILTRSGALDGYTIISEADKRKIIRTVLHNNDPAQSCDVSECMEVLSEISRLKSKEEPVGLHENLQTIYEEYNEMLKSSHKIDFDDMILSCYNLLLSNQKLLQEWQQSFSHILVDEFQDINRLQYQVLQLLAAPDNHLFGVGDDDQSIYGFRGSRPAVMREFFTDFPDARQVILTVNYRSTAEIVAAADLVIACNQTRIAKQYQALRQGSEVVVKGFPDREAEDGFLLEQLSLLPEAVRMDSAVILRTNSEVSLLAVKCLSQGIPVQTAEKPKDIFAHFIGTDILDYLYFSCQKQTRERYLNIINKPLRYISRKAAADLDGEVSEAVLLEYYQGNSDRQGVIRRFFNDCRRISRMTPSLAIHYLRKGVGYEGYLRERAQAAEYGEWEEILNLIQESAGRFHTFMEWFGHLEQQRHIKTMPGAGTGIRLITMHGSKGLEFHTVFLPHLNEGTIPGRKSRTADQIEEERRLFYVGMTRAKEELNLYYAASARDTPSRFLVPLLSEKHNGFAQSSGKE